LLLAGPLSRERWRGRLTSDERSERKGGLQSYSSRRERRGEEERADPRDLRAGARRNKVC
jgi:hypothetical protein